MGRYNAGVETRNHIIEVSKKLFYAQGFKNTKFAEICETAGVNSGTLAYHFQSKENLGKYIYTEMIAQEWKEILRIFPEEDEITYMYLSICVHQKLLFMDSGYRRFCSEMAGEFSAEFTQNSYRDLVPYTTQFVLKHLPGEEAEFYFHFISGADCRIASYINRYIGEITYETMIRYTSKYYFSYLDEQDRERGLERAMKLMKDVEISDIYFNISLAYRPAS